MITKAVVLLAALSIGGCAWYENMLSRSTPDTRIRLQPGQVMEFSMISRRNKQGQHMDEYRCGEEEIMWCDGYAVTLRCQCFSRH